ncbi:hypothetical protein HALO153_120031 [Vreelandella titanicae]|nr:hypothetical protein HALO153_120031 [Halomonas titanicae]
MCIFAPFPLIERESLSLLVLVLGFGEGDLIHGSTESYAVDDSRIITDGSDFFRASLRISNSWRTNAQ